ncbi:MAG: hypothetical protein J5748_00880 [Bacteroidales bacterium]|nr:hypothetical protein [Bacteroidales bacterium]
MKKGLVFFLGVLLGIALTIGAAFVANKLGLGDEELKMFDKPGKVMPIKSFTIIQTQPNGYALASYMNNEYDLLGAVTNVVLLIPNNTNASLYDWLQVDVPKKKCVRQVGTYRYKTKDGTMRTVPAVKVFDK